jgi:CRP/FNR family transcriptional regulator
VSQASSAISVTPSSAELISATPSKSQHRGITQLDLRLNLQPMAQMIGVSRETVTRLLGEFRNKGLIQLNGSNLVIKKKAALESMVCS